MDFFDLLIILVFIVFPIIEGLSKRRRKGRGAEGPSASGQDAGSESSAPSEVEEPRTAADMLSDDLWELMTGERRDSGAAGAPTEESSGTDQGDVAVAEERGWESEPWMDDSSQSREPVSLESASRTPVSLEYEGPEAYSLESPAPEPVERRVPTSAQRHRAFHEKVDRPRKRPRRRASPLVRSLRSREGLRQAVLLKEVLGPPKGLQ